MSASTPLREYFPDGVFAAGCPSRTVLDHVMSKWGLLVLLPAGILWIVLRRRVAIPVVAMWLACVVLYVLAAWSTADWSALLTGYWYNDKVRLASLAAVPGVVIVAAAAPAVRWVLRRFTPLRSRPWRVTPCARLRCATGCRAAVSGS